jgi:hypothetical protein
MVVLAVKAVKSTGMVENGQISVTVLSAPGNRIFGISAARAPRTDKITHTVGGKGIMIRI